MSLVFFSSQSINPFWKQSQEQELQNQKVHVAYAALRAPAAAMSTVDFIFFLRKTLFDFIKSCGGRIDLKFSGDGGSSRLKRVKNHGPSS